MLVSILLTILFTAGGLLLSYLYDEDAPLLFRVCAGAVTGSAAFGLIGFWLSLVIGFSVVTIVVATLIAAAPLILLRDRAQHLRFAADVHQTRNTLVQFFRKPRLGQIVIALLVAFILVVLWLFFNRAMIVRPDGIFTGVTNNLGDLPFHLSVITSFTEGNNFPPQDPSYAGARFTYPLLADFVAAAFVRMGASWGGAMFLQNLTLAIGLVAILYRYTFKLTRDTVAAIIAPLLLLFSGGLGWLMLFRQDRESGASLYELLSKLPHDYTIMPDTAYRWGNALTALLVTQRSLLFGLPLTLLVFTQWWSLISREPAADTAEPPTETRSGKKAKAAAKPAVAAPVVDPASRRATLQLLPAAIMAGALPLIHAHSFAVVISAALVLAVLFRKHWRTWVVFLVVALSLAIPQLIWITRGGLVETQSFLGFHFGWDNGVPDAGGFSGFVSRVIQPSGWGAFVVFWLRNTGLFIPLAFFAAVWMWGRGARGRRTLLFYVPFVFFFLGPNFVKLAPWVWDNIKVLIYWYVASIPLVAGWLGYVWNRDKFARVGVLAAVLILVMAGGLDVWRVISGATEIRIFDKDAVSLAEQVRKAVPSNALMLNAPTYNTPVFMTGRRSFLGYTGHVWSHGIDFQPRYRILAKIYAGGSPAMDLIEEQGIKYVVVSPLERSMLSVNNEFFREFPVVAQSGELTVYQVAP